MRKAFLGVVLLALAALVFQAAVSQRHGPAPGAGAGRAAPSGQAAQPAPRRGHPEIGFATQQKLAEHHRKHGTEFGTASQEQYLRLAQDLRDRPAGGGVLEHVRGDGVVTRFDRAGGAFLAFNADLTIRTFFKPNDGEAYFVRQSRRGTR